MARLVTALVLAFLASAPAFACGPYAPMITAQDDSSGLFAEAWGNTVFVTDGKTTTTVDVDATNIASLEFGKSGELVVHALDGETERRITYALVP